MSENFSIFFSGQKIFPLLSVTLTLNKMERSGFYEKNGSWEFINTIDGCWEF